MPIIPTADRADVNESAVAEARITVGTTPTEIKAGPTRLSGRQFVVAYNDSGQIVFTSMKATVTTAGADKGKTLYNRQERTWAVGELPVYAIASTPTEILVQEFA